ncbi:transcriptional regulator [Bacterioplanes sanyensis]|uniref:sigma-54-dependent transcriptional regulator n=1 Tax=Bacterioplanes sanyensis TaxID=1249553 RepID=UPI001674156F|nr:sigma-54 dependent transcriptional regulator [Bacterioplanes sanyensis]GGY38767.1 transcriptional regulator [Bacterioplanes sanyensis]
MSHILVVEDETIIRQALRRLLQRHDYEVTDVDSLDAARQQSLDQFDLIISDLRLPGGNGTELISLAGRTPVLIMTSYASLRSAVDSMKLGAVDYIAKPFDHDELVDAVRRILADSKATQTASPSTEQEQDYPVSGIIGSCEAMQVLFRKISKVAPTDATVLIQGESGTGKELVARALHAQSQRKNATMISVNCAAIPETLIESELFGHEKGAFTGATALRQGLVEAADGGTLFLDEIGELPLEAQARLLRVLQEGEIRRVGSVQSRKVDVRLIAATHRNLRELSHKGEFREDLYYRLNVMELHLPPLRDRGEDVVELAQALLGRRCEKMQLAAMQFSPEALDTVRRYHWPGNVRELENAIERAVILADDDQPISADLLGIDLSPDSYVSNTLKENLVQTEQPGNTDSEQGDLSLDDYFVHFVLENEARMTETELARKLGISRKSLWERRQRLGIPRKKK